jgi:hypothetical protein
MSDDHIEAILVWSTRGPHDRVEWWLTTQGLSCAPMRAGLLVSGSRHRFEQLFGVGLADRSRPVELSPPPNYRPWIDSFTVPPLRRPTQE